MHKLKCCEKLLKRAIVQKRLFQHTLRKDVKYYPPAYYVPRFRSIGEDGDFDLGLLDFIVCPITRTPLRFDSVFHVLISTKGTVIRIEYGIPIMVWRKMALEDQLTKKKETLILDNKLEIHDQDFFVKFTRNIPYNREKMHPDPKVRERERRKRLSKEGERMARAAEYERRYQEALKQTPPPPPPHLQ